MSPERWQKVLSIFHEALDRPADEHDAFLEEACSGDSALRHDVARLLDADARASILETGAPGLRLAIERDRLADTEIGPYHVDTEIGRGGMGVVYRATRTDIGSTVALKMLRERFPSTERVERFLQEQQVLGRLQHPGIARFLDAGLTVDGTPFFVMEYVEGTPITKACQDLGLQDRLERFLDVCDAVQHAHRQLVVHRDIKPSNVFVTPDGEVKLLDFGIAKLLEEDAGLTQTSERLLTPAYAAPEQVRAEDVSTATDVYALGALLYELLAEVRPLDVDGLPFPEAAERIIKDEPAPPSRRASSTGSLLSPTRIYGDLDTICLTALRKNPGRRYASVEAMRDDVERFLASRPITARPDSLSYRAAKFVRRNRAWVAASTAAVLVLGAVLTFYTARLADERDHATEQAAVAESVTAFLVETLEEGNPNSAAGDTLTIYDVVDRAEERAGALADEPLVQANVLDALGRVQHVNGDFDRADSLFRRSLTLRRSHLPPDHADIASSLNHLAQVRTQEGDYAAADSLMQASLAVYRRAAPQDLAVQVEPTKILAQVRYRQGQYAAADSLYRRVLALDDQTDALSPDGRADAHQEWGMAKFQQADYDGASQQYRQAVGYFQEVYPEGHHATASALANLASIERVAGNYEAASDGYQKALAMTQRILGPRHINIAIIENNLAVTYHRLGRVEDAASLLRENVNLRQELLGPDHPAVATARNNLGEMLNDLGDRAAAEDQFRKALSIREATLGPEHERTVTTLNNLAGIYEQRGDLDVATVMRRDVLRRYQRALGSDHPRVGLALTNLGALLTKQAAYPEAETVLNDALALRREILDPEHDDIAETLFAQGLLYAAQNRWQDAESSFREAYNIQRKAVPEHPSTARAALHLGDALRAQGRFEEAEPYIVDGMTLAPPASPDVREESRKMFHQFYDAWGRPDRASTVRDSLGLDVTGTDSDASINAGPASPGA